MVNETEARRGADDAAFMFDVETRSRTPGPRAPLSRREPARCVCAGRRGLPGALRVPPAWARGVPSSKIGSLADVLCLPKPSHGARPRTIDVAGNVQGEQNFVRS